MRRNIGAGVLFWRLVQRVALTGMLLAMPLAWYVGDQWKTIVLPLYLMLALALALGQWRRTKLLRCLKT